MARRIRTAERARLHASHEAGSHARKTSELCPLCPTEDEATRGLRLGYLTEAEAEEVRASADLEPTNGTDAMTDQERNAADSHIERIAELTGKRISVTRIQRWPATMTETIYFSNGQWLDRSYMWD